MTIVAVTASRTSPGATTLAAGLSVALSHRFDRSLLVEADPTGGVLSLRFGLDAAPSLMTFGSDSRNRYTSEVLWANTQDLRGTRCLAGPVDPRIARPWVERVTPTLSDHLPALGVPTVIDLGSGAEGSPSTQLAKIATTTLVVTRPHLAEIQSLLFQVRRLRDIGVEPALVTVGHSPHDPLEVAALCEVRLAAILPDSPRMAAALGGGRLEPRKFRRSLLWRTIGGLAEAVVEPAQAENPSELEQPDRPAAPEDLAASAPQPASVPPPPMRVAHAAPPPAPRSAPPSITRSVPAPVSTSLAGAAPAARQPGSAIGATLVFADGTRCALDPTNPTVIGRRSDCDIALGDEQVSRRHGSIRRTTTGWRFVDLGSRNGTAIDGRPCTDTVLRGGERIRLGRTEVVFETSPESPPATNQVLEYA